MTRKEARRDGKKRTRRREHSRRAETFLADTQRRSSLEDESDGQRTLFC